MFNAFWDWWHFNFWLGLSSLVAGLVVVSPFFLSKTLRKRISELDSHLETIGLVALLLAIVIIGLYNRLGASSGA